MKKGVYKNLSNAEYHAEREHYSSSVLKEALTDPVLWEKKYIKGEEIPSRFQSALDFGTYIHSLVLEPDTVETDYAVFNGPIKRGKLWELFELNNKGKIILSSKQEELAKKMYDHYMVECYLDDKGKHKLVSSMLEGGDKELSVFTSLYGAKVKARFDHINIKKGYIVDIKTTSSEISTVEQAAKVVKDLKYDLSASLYLRIAEKQWKKPFEFYLCFLSKTSECTKLYKVSSETALKAEGEVVEALKLIKGWKKRGTTKNYGIEAI